MASLQRHGSSSGNMEDWVAVQKKTFTRWANSYLSKVQKEIVEVSEDFSDGTRLGALLEVISNEKLPKMNQNAKIEIQKLENLNKCLQFLKEKEIPLVNIGSKDIFSGNEKLILGLLWTIILRFEVGDSDGKNGLLLWVQRSCKGYANVDPPNVQNFSGDWSTGLPFCAIINRYRPDMLTYDGLSPNNAEHNCELAFAAAEKLGIARLLDVGDVANHPRPDEKSIIAYVSQFFKLFAKASKNDALIKSIKNAVDVTTRHDAWIEKYDKDSDYLMQFSNQKAGVFNGGSAASNTPQVQAELEEFTKYMREERPQVQSTKAEVDAIYTQLVNSKRNNKRPDFTPRIQLAQLQEAWQKLEESEQNQEKLLLNKFARFQQIDGQLAGFSGRAASMKAWLEEQNTKFSNPLPPGLSLTQLESELEAQDSTEDRLNQYSSVLKELQASAAKIGELGQGEHEACDSVAATAGELDALTQAVGQMSGTYRSTLEQAIAAEKEAVSLERSFKKSAATLDFTLDQLETLANQDVVVSSAADVTALRETLAQHQQDAQAAEVMINDTLLPVAQKIAERRPEHSQHVASEQQRLAGINQALANRAQVLDQKLSEETGRDQLRDSFASLANAVGPELEKCQLGGGSGALEDQLEQVRKTREVINGKMKTDLEALDEIAVKCDAAGIFNFPGTPHTILSLRATHRQLLKSVDDEEASLQAQILAKKALQVSPEQLKEIQEVFQFFDSDNTGTIALKELIEACTASGVDLEESEIEKRMKERNPKMVFNMEEFTNFMLAEMKSGDTLEDVMAAFEQLGDNAEKIDMAALGAALQSDPDLKNYIVAAMQDGDFRKFVEELFSR